MTKNIKQTVLNINLSEKEKEALETVACLARNIQDLLDKYNASDTELWFCADDIIATILKFSNLLRKN